MAINATAAFSACCHLESDTDISTVLLADYRAASFLRLWESSIHPAQATKQNSFPSEAARDFNLYFVVFQKEK